MVTVLVATMLKICAITVARQFWLQKYPDLPSTRIQIVCGYKNFHSRERIQKFPDNSLKYSDACGRKAYPQLFCCGYENIRIRVDGVLQTMRKSKQYG